MDNDIQSLVARTVEEAMRQLNAAAAQGGGILAVFAGYVFDTDGIAEYLKGTQTEVTCALFEDAQFEYSGFILQRVETKEERAKLAARLRGYERVVLVTPPLGLLRAVADGDDSDFAASLALRPLLWGKDVTLLLDFDISKTIRSTLWSGLPDILSTLGEYGVKTAVLHQRQGAATAKDLVTEQDVKDAVKAESMRVTARPGAIVTQLAQDTAKELGVTIETGE